MFGCLARVRRLQAKVDSQAETIAVLRALADKLGKERDAAVEKFEITHEALVEARQRIRRADGRETLRRLREVN